MKQLMGTGVKWQGKLVIHMCFNFVTGIGREFFNWKRILGDITYGGCARKNFPACWPAQFWFFD